jgi:cyclic pyranopterin phosphate synthase
MMQDGIGRTIRYLRLSLTTACQMRCLYCRPSILGLAAEEDLLSAEEIESVVAHLVSRHGVRKVRLTGGDPTARPDLVEIVARLAKVPGLADLTMTTNGWHLTSLAGPLSDAGLSRVNVSLDSLDGDQFARITGTDGLGRALAGIAAAREAGLAPIKINTVVVRGENEGQIPHLVDFAAKLPAEIRFIEMMPMGPLARQWQDRFVPAAEIRQRLEDTVAVWQATAQGADSAKSFDATLRNGLKVRIGFIAPMSCQFCSTCHRVRIDAAGEVLPCLMDRPRGSLMPAIRPVFNARRFDRLLAAAMSFKQREHPTQGVAVMTCIGG